MSDKRDGLEKGCVKEEKGCVREEGRVRDGVC